MSFIVSTKRNKTGVVLEVQTNYEEYLALEGHLDEVHLFTDKRGEIETRISQRGKNGATKYFLVPKHLRKGFKINNVISCQRIDKDDRIFFIYSVDKMQENPSKRKTIESKYKLQIAQHIV